MKKPGEVRWMKGEAVEEEAVEEEAVKTGRAPKQRLMKTPSLWGPCAEVAAHKEGRMVLMSEEPCA